MAYNRLTDRIPEGAKLCYLRDGRRKAVIRNLVKNMTLLLDAFNLFQSIPATFWGVVTGSALTLGGIILTNRANDRRARAQFQHEQNLRTKERELTLKKEIYLSAVETVSAGLKAVATFANLDVSYDQLIQPYADKSAEIGKVHVIGNDETLNAIATISSELNGAILRLAIKRIPLAQMKQQIVILAEQLAPYEKEQARILQLMTEHNIEGNPDQRRFDVLKGNFDFNHKQILEHTARINNMHAVLQQQQITYANECLTSSRELSALAVPAVLAVRRELELPINEPEYKRLTDGLLAKQKTDTGQFLGQMRDVIEGMAASLNSEASSPAPTPAGSAPRAESG
jgi:hypothetical protein